jgi:hypothetical protein
MTEQELRQLVREAIARTQGRAGNPLNPLNPLNPGPHASHAIFPVESGADQDGPCIIEPAVMCNHCGYCKSLGH